MHRFAATAATSAVRATAAHRRCVVLCADFDKTLTQRDTIALLFERAAERQPTERARAAHTAQVQQLVAQYMAELHALESVASAACAPEAAPLSGRSSPLRFDADALDAYLARYAAVDRQSIERVMNTRVLQGICTQDLVASAQQIELLPSCLDALQSADAAYVVSSNWSATMLDAALHAPATATPDTAHRAITVITNDLEVDSEGVTTGAIRLRVQSPQDKAHWIQHIRARESPDAERSDAPLVVFVGDSANDLLALLDADVGIVLAPAADASFRELARRYRVQLEFMRAPSTLAALADTRHAAVARGERVLFAAESWRDIHRALQ